MSLVVVQKKSVHLNVCGAVGKNSTVERCVFGKFHQTGTLTLTPGEETGVCGGQMGEGGQGRERVQHPDSLVDKAVSQSAGPGPEAPQSPS